MCTSSSWALWEPLAAAACALAAVSQVQKVRPTVVGALLRLMKNDVASNSGSISSTMAGQLELCTDLGTSPSALQPTSASTLGHGLSARSPCNSRCYEVALAQPSSKPTSQRLVARHFQLSSDSSTLSELYNTLPFQHAVKGLGCCSNRSWPGHGHLVSMQSACTYASSAQSQQPGKTEAAAQQLKSPRPSTREAAARPPEEVIATHPKLAELPQSKRRRSALWQRMREHISIKLAPARPDLPQPAQQAQQADSNLAQGGSTDSAFTSALQPEARQATNFACHSSNNQVSSGVARSPDTTRPRSPTARNIPPTGASVAGTVSAMQPIQDSIKGATTAVTGGLLSPVTAVQPGRERRHKTAAPTDKGCTSSNTAGKSSKRFPGRAAAASHNCIAASRPQHHMHAAGTAVKDSNRLQLQVDKRQRGDNPRHLGSAVQTQATAGDTKTVIQPVTNEASNSQQQKSRHSQQSLSPFSAGKSAVESASKHVSPEQQQYRPSNAATSQASKATSAPSPEQLPYKSRNRELSTKGLQTPKFPRAGFSSVEQTTSHANPEHHATSRSTLTHHQPSGVNKPSLSPQQKAGNRTAEQQPPIPIQDTENLTEKTYTYAPGTITSHTSPQHQDAANAVDFQQEGQHLSPPRPHRPMQLKPQPAAMYIPSDPLLLRPQLQAASTPLSSAVQPTQLAAPSTALPAQPQLAESSQTEDISKQVVWPVLPVSKQKARTNNPRKQTPWATATSSSAITEGRATKLGRAPIPPNVVFNRLTKARTPYDLWVRVYLNFDSMLPRHLCGILHHLAKSADQYRYGQNPGVMSDDPATAGQTGSDMASVSGSDSRTSVHADQAKRANTNLSSGETKIQPARDRDMDSLASTATIEPPTEQHSDQNNHHPDQQHTQQNSQKARQPKQREADTQDQWAAIQSVLSWVSTRLLQGRQLQHCDTEGLAEVLGSLNRLDAAKHPLGPAALQELCAENYAKLSTCDVSELSRLMRSAAELGLQAPGFWERAVSIAADRLQLWAAARKVLFGRDGKLEEWLRLPHACSRSTALNANAPSAKQLGQAAVTASQQVPSRARSFKQLGPAAAQAAVLPPQQVPSIVPDFKQLGPTAAQAAVTVSQQVPSEHQVTSEQQVLSEDSRPPGQHRFARQIQPDHLCKAWADIVSACANMQVHSAALLDASLLLAGTGLMDSAPHRVYRITQALLEMRSASQDSDNVLFHLLAPGGVANLTPLGTCSLLTALVEQQMYSPQLCSLLAQHVAARFPDKAQPSAVSWVLRLFARLGHHDVAMCKALLADVCVRVDEFLPGELSGALWAMATLQHDAADVSALLSSPGTYKKLLSHPYNTQHLLSTLWSLAALDLLQPHRELATALVRQISTHPATAFENGDRDYHASLYRMLLVGLCLKHQLGIQLPEPLMASSFARAEYVQTAVAMYYWQGVILDVALQSMMRSGALKSVHHIHPLDKYDGKLFADCCVVLPCGREVALQVQKGWGDFKPRAGRSWFGVQGMYERLLERAMGPENVVRLGADEFMAACKRGPHNAVRLLSERLQIQASREQIAFIFVPEHLGTESSNKVVGSLAAA